jgi:hypothetical protein
MSPKTTKLGPGLLTIGATGSEIDISCNLIGARIKTNVDTEDPVTYLCGDQEPGTMTFDSELTGTLNIDVVDGAASLFDLSWSAKGSEQPFVYEPFTGVVSAAGVLVITPLDLGADAFGDRLNSEFTWPLVGDPTFTYTPPPP